MATISRIGFGQVEPNHLSAQRTAQIYAQLPAKSDMTILENGQFVKYDYANGEVNLTGPGEWMLVFNEVKLYDDMWRESYKDFAMIKENYTPGTYMVPNPEYTGPEDETHPEYIEKTVEHGGMGPLKGQMVPRVFKTNVGDIYTTNCVGAANTSGKAKYDGIDLTVGTNLKVDSTGYLVPGTDATMQWQVVKVYTMADGQPAVKVMRVK